MKQEFVIFLFCDALESDDSITAKAVKGKKSRAVYQGWQEAFFPNVKRNTGRWVYRGYR
ncbi:MAG: hypothetical protein ACR2OA_21090 [Rubripirellula sp.]|jgi:hypothetical protein